MRRRIAGDVVLHGLRSSLISLSADRHTAMRIPRECRELNPHPHPHNVIHVVPTLRTTLRCPYRTTPPLWTGLGIRKTLYAGRNAVDDNSDVNPFGMRTHNHCECGCETRRVCVVCECVCVRDSITIEFSEIIRYPGCTADGIKRNPHKRMG